MTVSKQTAQLDDIYLHTVIVCVLSGGNTGDLRQRGEGRVFARVQRERHSTGDLLPDSLHRLQPNVRGAGEEVRGGGFETGPAHGEWPEARQ